jgi:ABC-type dipeptide/oligopeptide/nickel transport system permease subunit
MKGPASHLIEKTEDAASRAINLSTSADGDLFTFAGYDMEAAEKAGYSNYSYWSSTFRVFFKNKVAVTLLAVLAILVAFTFVQPLLPNQYEATRIINHPITGMQMSNIAPSLTTVKITAPAGTELIVTKRIDDTWVAVSNVLDTIKARVKFTVLEYGDAWCKVSLRGLTGYVKNDFTTKLKLPAAYADTPYEAYANFPVKLYLSPQDLTNNGVELFVSASDLTFIADNNLAKTTANAGLCILPSGAPMLFGTNNAGQDLWAMVWSGTRTSLFIGFMVALVEAAVGIFVGVVWGYVRKLDRILTEVYNVVDNIPTTIVLILIAYIMRPGVSTLIFAMCLTGWIGMALFVRNQIVIIRDRDYNLASRCLGTGTFRIIVRNLLPYLVSVIMLRMALAIPGAIGSEVFITYIGLGLPLATPSLGNLITVGRKLISTSQSYQLYFPTIVLSVITISFYIIGNAFSDSADPKNHL